MDVDFKGSGGERYSGFSPNVMKTFVKPGIAAVIMGIAVLLIYRVFHLLTGHNSIATIIGIPCRDHHLFHRSSADPWHHRIRAFGFPQGLHDHQDRKEGASAVISLNQIVRGYEIYK